MNLKAWILSVAIASAAAASGSSSGSGSTTDAPLTQENLSSRPGLCNTSKDCAKYTKGSNVYSCIAVKSNIVNLTTLKQCVLGDGCSGGKAGSCPTFTSWPQKFRQVQPVCAFVAVPNCNSAVNSQGQVVSVRSLREQAAKPGNVTCFQAKFGSNSSSSDDSATVYGIYQCVDKKLYAEKNLGYLDNTPKQLQSCAGNVTVVNGQSVSNVLCNGHGTCVPQTDFSDIYKCLCSTGYSDKDNCGAATGNVCSAFGQCGNGNCNPDTGKCVCPYGSTGDQCSKCDPAQNNNASVTNMCNGNGKCGIDGTCQCSDGYLGTNCETQIKKNSTASSATGSTTSSKKSAASGLHEASIAIFSIATIFAAALI
ncbi:hypothetical protein THRCLA_03852 [Thraustotheca clavata]|uniref:Secreted protein n=1 Tax=Thraustotheca clavata TaxID=74557 RepID=A0A0A7CLY9_9STRA|nr:secreted protein [Thraustotheca clavata]OQS03867.1 hypothetical protein THRCLA_03852 [Thraustotheca clavata]